MIIQGACAALRRPGRSQDPKAPTWRHAAALLAACALVSVSCARNEVKRNRAAEGDARLTAVRLARVEAQEFRRTIESVGSLFPDEEVAVSSEVEGPVEQVLADVGDRVARGQPLVKISPRELALALEHAGAAVQQVRAQLGLPENQPDLRDVRDAAEVKKAQADLRDTEQKYQRAKNLLARNLVSRESYEEAEARHKAARAAYDLAVQNVENLRAQLARNRASMELARKKLDDSTIRAPFAGEVKERMVAVGQYLKVQSAVMVIVNVNPLRARLKIPEKMAAWVQVGQTASIAVEAYPGQKFAGKISRLNPSVDEQTRTFEAEARIANRDGRLRPGFFVKASIPTSRVEKALFLPDEAVQYTYGVYRVFLIEGSTLKEREVRIGEHPPGRVEIVEGVQAGQTVALPVPGGELRENAAIKVVDQPPQGPASGGTHAVSESH